MFSGCGELLFSVKDLGCARIGAGMITPDAKDAIRSGVAIRTLIRSLRSEGGNRIMTAISQRLSKYDRQEAVNGRGN